MDEERNDTSQEYEEGVITGFPFPDDTALAKFALARLTQGKKSLTRAQKKNVRNLAHQLLGKKSSS